MADGVGGGKPLLEARVRLRADGSALAGEATSEAAKAATQAADAYADKMTKGAKAKISASKDKLVPKGSEVAAEAEKAGEKVGEEFTKGFTSRTKDRLGKATAKQLDALDGLGDRALIAGAAVAAGVGAAVVSFAQFDQAMSRAQAGTRTTAEGMVALRAAAIDAGKRTQFSATGAADAITAMGKAGVSTADILGGGLDGALSLAAAGELEVGDAAEIAATALTQFNLKGADLGHVADVLAAGAGKAQGNVSDLANALKYVGPIASAMGVSLDETVGVLSEFASQGILGEQAGTSLRGVIASLTGPSDKAAGVIEDLGLKVYNSQGQFVGLADVASQLQAAFVGMTEEQKNAALATIFGRETLTAATILYKGGSEAVRDWTAAVNDSGYAAEQAALLMDNLSGDVEQLKGSLETAFIQSGSGANDGLRALTQGATGVVNAFLALPDPIQKSTVLIGGAAAAGLLLAGGLIKGAVAAKKLKADMVELGVSTERVNTVMSRTGKIAAGLGTAFVALSFVPDVANTLDRSLGNVSGSTSDLALELTKFAKGADLGAEASKGFGSNLEGTGRSLGNLGTKVEGLKAAVNDLSGANGVMRKDLPLLGSPEARQIEAYSQALAELAQKDAPTAAQAFLRLSKAAGLTTEEQGRLLDLMPEYKGILNGVAAEQVAAGDGAKVQADAMSVLKGQLRDAAGAAEDYATALADANKAAADFNGVNLDARAAARAYRDALSDASKAVEENGRAHGVGSEKARDNEAALDDLAKAAQDNADAILATTGSQKQYEGALKGGRAALIRLAQQMGYTGPQAKALADKILSIPRVRTTKVGLQGAGAVNYALDTLLDRVNALDGRRIQVYASAGNVREDRRPGRSTGGPVPGRPSEVDSLPYMLAPGEYVVRAREASKAGNRALLDAMNDGRPVTAPAAVSGGVSGGVGSVDHEAIASAVTRGVVAAMTAMGPGRVVLDDAVVGRLLRSGGGLAGIDTGGW